jgi:hypothetical protein
MASSAAEVAAMKALQILVDVQNRLVRDTEPGTPSELINRLCVTPVDGRLHVDFYGTPFDEPLQHVLQAIATPEVSQVLASLTLRGPDEGANGTRNWDLNVLANSDVIFLELREMFIEQTKPVDHNRTIVASTYDEDGVLARILTRAPKLETLVTPSAPDSTFFQVDRRPVKLLNVDAGYDTQGFIRNLARSSCFPDLQCLEFGEYNETYIDDYASRCTPAADYEELFTSGAFKPVRRFVWRNPVCPAAEIAAFKAMRRDLQLLVVRTSADYVR